MTLETAREYLDTYFADRKREPLDYHEFVNGHDDSAPPLAIWTAPGPITDAEWTSSILTPRPIIPSYLYADVGLLVAPGGTGKTTLALWECVHVVLGRSLYGREPGPSGVVLLVTAEDRREQLVARLRLIVAAMSLTEAEIAIVRRDLRISDVSGEGFKLTTIAGEAVVPSVTVDILIAEVKALNPLMVIFDPAVSFGIGEARVNDAEQGLIEAGRRIRNEIGCCVRYIAHTGKNVAREKIADQYAGRGGSALADGSRMVAVLHPLAPDEWNEATGDPLRDREQGLVLSMPKLSYCEPQADILIRRGGYGFTFATRVERDAGTRLHENMRQVIRIIEHDAAKGRMHTQRTLEALRVMPRVDLRDALNTLLVREEVLLVKAAGRKGGAQHFLQVQAAPVEGGAPSVQ